MKFILPLVMLLVGTGAGFGTGMVLRPDPGEHAGKSEKESAKSDKKTDKKKAEKKKDGKKKGGDPDKDAVEYLKMNNQFVVPIVRNRDVTALVVLGLSVEVSEGSKEMVYANEPKLRDAFLQVLFDHANAGGFDGAFTEVENLQVLRQALLEVGQKYVGVTVVRDILIQEIARQDY